MDGKYIVVRSEGHEVAVCFSRLLNHKTVGRPFKVVSAGFFEVDAQNAGAIEVTCYGRSESLNLGNRPIIDKTLVTRLLTKGS